MKKEKKIVKYEDETKATSEKVGINKEGKIVKVTAEDKSSAKKKRVGAVIFLGIGNYCRSCCNTKCFRKD